MHKSLTIAAFNAPCTWRGGFGTQGIICRQLHWKIVASRNILGHVIHHMMRNEGHLWSVLSQHDWTVWSLAYFMETIWMSHWIWSPMSWKKKCFLSFLCQRCNCPTPSDEKVAMNVSHSALIRLWALYCTAEEGGWSWTDRADSGAVGVWDLVHHFLVACFQQQDLLTLQVGIHACKKQIMGIFCQNKE